MKAAIKTGKGHSLRNSPLTRSDQGTKAPPTSIVMTREEFATHVNSCKGLNNLPKSLFLDYKKDPSDFKRNLIVEFYSFRVQKIAEKLASKLPESVTEWDIFSSGIIGLIDALAKYKPEKGIKFSTYFPLRVHGAMLDQLRQEDWTPRLVRKKAKKLSDAAFSLVCSLKREPTDVEMAEHLGMTMGEYWKLVKGGTPVLTESLEQTFHDNDRGKPVLLRDVIEDKKTPCPRLEAQKRRAFSYICHGLSKRDRLLLRLYYKDGKTLKEAGRIAGISESRVSQLIKMSFKTIKRTFSGKEELAFADK